MSYIRPILVQLSDPEKTKKSIGSIITDEHLNVDEEDIVKRIERIKTEVDTAVLPPFYFIERQVTSGHHYIMDNLLFSFTGISLVRCAKNLEAAHYM